MSGGVRLINYTLYCYSTLARQNKISRATTPSIELLIIKLYVLSTELPDFVLNSVSRSYSVISLFDGERSEGSNILT